MFKPDDVTVRGGAATAEFEPHPDGSFLARCVDVISLGQRVEQYEGNPERLVEKVALVFVTGETKEFNGQLELIPLVKEFTASKHEKASLRKFVESWRGKSYKDAELDEGLPLSKLAGQFCQLTVEHRVSVKNGRTYANILAVAPLMKGMQKPEHLGTEYVRPSWIEKKKADYAEQAQAFLRKIGADKPVAPRSSFTAPPKTVDDDSLPF